MPYNGSGVFNRNYSWVNDKNSAIPITASRMDGDSNDFANGLSSVVTRDGQGPATAKVIVNGAGATPITGGIAFDPLSAQIALNFRGSGHWANVLGVNNGVPRWEIDLGNGDPESGAGSGSNFGIYRYDDAGAINATQPLSIDRATGVVTIASLNVLSGITAPISASDITASGNLSIGGTSSFTGIATFHADYGVQLNVAAGLHAQYVCTVAGQRQWSIGEETTGYFRIADLTAGLERLTINSAGLVTIGGGATIVGAITSSTSLNVSVAGGSNALTWSTVAGVRSWYAGVISTGQFWITDQTGVVNRLQIDTAGHMTVNGALTCNSNFNTNQINGTVVVAATNFQCNSGAGSAQLYLQTNTRSWSVMSSVGDGFLYFFDNSAAALRMYIETGGRVVHNQGIYVAGVSTLIGTVGCNAINCTAINTQNNNLTMGLGDITCNVITASGSLGVPTITGNVSFPSSPSVGGSLTVSGNVICGNQVHSNNLLVDASATIGNGMALGGGGVEYTLVDTQFIAFRFNTGTSLSLFVGGGLIGSQNFNVSDERLKQNIAPAKGTALEELLQVRLINFDLPDRIYPERPVQHFDYGFSAQQLETLIPEAVNTSRRYDLENPSDETVLSLDTLPLIARLVGAVQQLAARVEALEGARP